MNVAGNQSAATGGWALLGQTPAGLNNAATTVAFQSGSEVAIASGKTVQLGNNAAAGGFAAQTLNAAGSVTNGGTLQIGRSGILNINSGGSWTQSGAATVATQGGGVAAMTVNSGGSFTYASGSTFQLNTSTSVGTQTNLTLNGGTFTTGTAIRNATATVTSGTASNVILNNGGTLKLSSNVASLATTAGGTINFQVGQTGSGGMIDTNGFNTTLDRPINDVSGQAGKLTKTGNGTLTLTGPLAYTGGTTVNGGTLLVNTSLTSSEVTVNSGATLGGTGILGSVVIGANGTLNPGESIGVLGLGSADVEGIFELDYGGLGIDLLNVSGIFDITLAAANFVGTSAELTASSYIFATYGTLVGGQFATANTPVGYTIDYAYGGNNIALVAVPEPASALTCCLGFTLAWTVFLRRRRR